MVFIPKVNYIHNVKEIHKKLQTEHHKCLHLPRKAQIKVQSVN